MSKPASTSRSSFRQEKDAPNDLVAGAPHVFLLLDTVSHRVDDGVERLAKFRDVAALGADILDLPPRIPRHAREAGFDRELELAHDGEEGCRSRAGKQLFLGFERDPIAKVGVDSLL